MQIQITYGGMSNTFVEMTVDSSATGLDILQALKDGDALGVDPATGTYVVNIAKSGKTLPANGTLEDAGVRDGDQLIVVSTEQGYAPYATAGEMFQCK